MVCISLFSHYSNIIRESLEAKMFMCSLNCTYSSLPSMYTPKYLMQEEVCNLTESSFNLQNCLKK